MNRRTVIIVIFFVFGLGVLFYEQKKEEKIEGSFITGESGQEDNSDSRATGPVSQTDSKAANDIVTAYICGAVSKPGVYELEEGARVGDAISMAGGFTLEADEVYLNLAEPVADGSKIYVPTVEETDEKGYLPIDGSSDESSSPVVNINTAGEDMLTSLPGIGQSKAKSIVEYRESNGKFLSIEDIKNVSGIGERLFEQIKELITV